MHPKRSFFILLALLVASCGSSPETSTKVRPVITASTISPKVVAAHNHEIAVERWKDAVQINATTYWNAVEQWNAVTHWNAVIADQRAVTDRAAFEKARIDRVMMDQRDADERAATEARLRLAPTPVRPTTTTTTRPTPVITTTTSVRPTTTRPASVITTTIPPRIVHLAPPSSSPRPLSPVASSGRCGGNLPPCYVMLRESRGDIRAENPTSTASGKWQVLDSTWNGFGGYGHASAAPESVQDAFASQLWDGKAGCHHWAAC